MREILFRGKRIYDGKWIYGNLVVDKSLEPHIVPHDFFFEDGHHLVYDDETDNPVFIFKDSVGQYTGLTDKNGQWIFEGDIMEFDAWGFHYRGVVSFVDGNSSVICKRPVSDISASPFLDDAIKRYDAVCVGNIHDNLELLEANK